MIPITVQDAKIFSTLQQENRQLTQNVQGLKRELDTASQAIETLQKRYNSLAKAARNALDVMQTHYLFGPLEPDAFEGAIKSLRKELEVPHEQR